MRSCKESFALILLVGIIAACNPRAPDSGEAAPAPVDTPPDTLTLPQQGDTLARPTPDTSVATPPITPPPQDTGDTSPSAPQPSDTTQPAAAGGGGKVSQAEYDGWRHYSVHCARCHGQDALPNPVAANLLVSVGPGGRTRSPGAFSQVVSEGRPERGMPGFKSALSADQIEAIYQYLKGRADKRIPPGRPTRASG
jgi:mono/diheme cytochrome c family protein